jgi:erythrin-vacuolar iron transport family protein
MRTLSELTEKDVLALAIASEEEDSRIYDSFAETCREAYPATASIFDEMANEERGHRDSLYAHFRERFGERLPPIRREDVRGFLKRRALWWQKDVTAQTLRAEAAMMEVQAANFYDRAGSQAQDLATRQLFIKLAEVERGHEKKAEALEDTLLTGDAKESEAAAAHRQFVLTFVQPGLAGLIDGSVSTLAPVFAAAFATQNNHQTFLIGLAASLGAGISMGITEAMSDDGKISGRGSPWVRGVACGVMTAVGGLGHTFPYLVPDGWPNAFFIATSLALVIVVIELWLIAWIRTRYMETPFLRSMMQVVVGGALVVMVGLLIGSS